MKKKVLLSSIVTIALCLCLIAGSTFALFTSRSEVNIAVTAGKVEMVAGIEITKLESVRGDAAGTIVDENGATYSYEEVSPTFTNGGTAEVTGSVLTLKQITPGDKVTFKVSGTNNSDVAIQYRYIIECTEGYNLMSGLVVTVDKAYESLNSFTSPWTSLEAGKDITPVTVSLELPVDAGNEYQKQSAAIKVIVEAVQGNAVVDDNAAPIVTYINKAATADAAANAIAGANEGDVVMLTAGEFGDLEITNSLKDVTILATPETNARFKIKKGASLDAVTFKGLDLAGDGFAAYDGFISIEEGAYADLTFKNCTFAPNANYSSVRSYDDGAKLEFVDCKFESGRYSVYKSGAPVSELVFVNCEFSNISSWIYQSHDGSTAGAVKLVVDGCTFDNCKGGFLKCSGSYADGSIITFTNNVIADNCTGHDGNSAKWFELSVANCTVTVSGNKLGTADWNPAAAEGLKY